MKKMIRLIGIAIFIIWLIFLACAFYSVYSGTGQDQTIEDSFGVFFMSNSLDMKTDMIAFTCSRYQQNIRGLSSNVGFTVKDMEVIAISVDPPRDAIISMRIEIARNGTTMATLDNFNMINEKGRWVVCDERLANGFLNYAMNSAER